MARKLSGRLLVHLSLWAVLAVPKTRAAAQMPAATAGVVENPFAAKRTETPAPSAPKRTAMPPRKVQPYQNPFANMPKSPPIEPTLKPGPVSRWQRPVFALAEESPIKAAMLLPRPRTLPSTWDQLPPVDILRQKAGSQNVDLAASVFYNNLFRPGTATKFTPEPLVQPGSILDGDLPEIASASPTDHFATPYTVGMAAAAPIDPLPQPLPFIAGRVTEAYNILPAGAIEPADPSADTISPEIISDIDDAPEDWLQQAQHAASAAQSHNDLTNVIDLCNRGIRNIPPAELLTGLRRLAAWAHNRRGELAADEQRHHEAFHDFQVAISLDPNCSLALHNRGVSLAQRNQFAAALRDFNRVIELNPGLAVAYRNRAELLTAIGRLDEAVTDFTRAIQSLPEDSSLLLARAHAYQRLGNFGSAAGDISRAIQIAPNDPDAYTQRGNLAFDQGKFEQALRDFHWAIEIDPNWAAAHRSLAWLQATSIDPSIRNAEASLAAARRAAELSAADDYLVLDTLAAAHACAGQFDKAAQLQEQALSAAPRDISTGLEQRLALYKQGKAYLHHSADDAIRTVSHETTELPGTNDPRSAPSQGPRPSPQSRAR